MAKMISETYIINKNDFDFYKDIFEKQFEPKSAIQIPIILPFQFPVPDSIHIGACSLLGKYGFIFKFRKLKILQTVETDIFIVNALFQKEEIYRTYVEMLYVTEEEIAFQKENTPALDKILFTLLKDLNSILLSYSFFKTDIDIYSITNQMLFPRSLVRCFNINDWVNNEVSYSHFNSNTSLEKPCINAELFAELIDYSFSSKILFNPLLNSEVFAMDSLKNYRQGLRKEAVVNIQTSIESFVKTIFTLLVQEEKMGKEKINNCLDNYKNLLTQQFKKRIGGIWDLDNIKCEAGAYYIKTYKLRNAIVHQGYEPMLVETNIAIKSALNFKEYILNLLEIANKSEIRKFVAPFYHNRKESFASQIFSNDLKFDLVGNKGKLKETIDALNASLFK